MVRALLSVLWSPTTSLVGKLGFASFSCQKDSSKPKTQDEQTNTIQIIFSCNSMQVVVRLQTKESYIIKLRGALLSGKISPRGYKAAHRNDARE
ncbi:MAG: hypothetical protein QM640_03590 [Niabella sp.]